MAVVEGMVGLESERGIGEVFLDGLDRGPETAFGGRFMTKPAGNRPKT